MEEFYSSSSTIHRIQEYTKSDFFMGKSKVSKSSYWKEHAEKLNVDILQTKLIVQGDSGVYIPSSANRLRNLWDKLIKVISNPKRIITFLTERFFKYPKLFSYRQAFDLVMSHNPVSDPDLSPHRVNHLKIKAYPNVYKTAFDVKRDYDSWSGRITSEHIYMHYYYLNLIYSFTDASKIRFILEIGGGNGNFSSILFKHLSGISIILVDLPEMIPISFSFLSSVFPKANFILPNEITNIKSQKFDFLFLTTDQLDLVPNQFIDLCINCHSFQEMPRKQIEIYFKFIERILKKSGYFFTANRLEKIPVGQDAYSMEQPDLPNQFHRYPWNPRSTVLIDEVSRMTRLVQLDSVGIRLERKN